MNALFGRLRNKLIHTVSPQPNPIIDLGDNIDDGQIYRHRKQRGVNLGSWFVLEPWITDTPFAQAIHPRQSDLDVAKGPHAKEILERHWDTWITNKDFEWLAARGINAVRIPIGYYHLTGLDHALLAGTDFQGLDSVFEGAWTRLVRTAETAQLYGIGVLFDLHSAPGKQNQDSHSGTSSSSVLFTTRANLELTARILRTLLTAVRSLRSEREPPITNIIGIELLNEPKPPSHSTLKDWYGRAIKELRALDPGLPIYISDCWMSDDYAHFVKSLPKSAPICLDHHLYRCFTQGDISTPAAHHSVSLMDPDAPTPQTFARVASILEDAGGALVVGEWSGALNPGSLEGPINQREERARYVSAQLALFEQHCAGWFFWTYKKERRGDQGWSFRDAVEAGVFPDRVGVYPIRNVSANDPDRVARKAVALGRATSQHTSYWAQYSGGHYEHWRFSKGYDQGWEDAYQFLLHNVTIHRVVSELGFQGTWKKRRAHDHGMENGISSNLWEYEHGYVQGIRDANLDFQAAYC